MTVSRQIGKLALVGVVLLACILLIVQLGGKAPAWWIIVPLFVVAVLVGAGLLASIREWFKAQDEGWVTRVAIVLDGCTKLVTIGGVIVAIYLFTLFQQGTESMNLTLESRPMVVGKKRFLEVAVKMENVGKVRVTLTGGFLRLQTVVSEEGELGLAYRFVPDPAIPAGATFFGKWEDRLILTSHMKDYRYPPNPDKPPPGSRLESVPVPSGVIPENDKNSIQNDMVFDPGEKHTITYLFEYQGSGICVVTSRFDGNEVLYYWHASHYVRLPPEATKPGN